MKQLDEVDGDFVDRAETVARTSQVIPAPPEVVWTWLVDRPGSWAQWFPRCRSCSYTSGDGSVGTRRRIAMNPLWADEVVVTCEPHERWGFAVVGTNIPGLARLYEQVQLEPTETPSGTATRLSYTGAFDSARWARPTGKVSAAIFAKLWSDGFSKLAELVAAEVR